MGKKIKMVLPKEDKLNDWVHGKKEDPKTSNQINLKESSNSQPKVKKENNRISINDKEDFKRLTIDLPSNIHKAFKIKVMTNDSTMVDVVNQFITDYVNN